MKGLAAIGVAGLIAAAGVLWFSTNPTVVVTKLAPVQPNAAIPSFKPVPTRLAQ
jgi:hypothetical protein